METSATRLFDVWAEVPDSVWDESWVALGGGKPAWISPFSRWRETEIHHVDLDFGYETGDWPTDFVRVVLPDIASHLPERLPAGTAIALEATDMDLAFGEATAGDARTVAAPARTLLAWLTGRLSEQEANALDLPPLPAWA